MKYEIYYAVVCSTGKIRNINQDNFWVEGKYLEAANNGLEKTETGKSKCEDHPVFAVFDGMGGEQYGEIAAHIAAKTFDDVHKSKDTVGAKDFLIGACRQMNDSITAFAKQKLAECVGTTAAMIAFGEKDICACNIGDSRIYHCGGKKLTQISKDHVVDIFKDRKAPLSQFLGIPESEFAIEPYMAYGSYKDGERYLICSDGLTDMVTEDEIKDILSENKDVEICADILLERALANGGTDNITVILCKVQKRQKSIFEKLFNT